MVLVRSRSVSERESRKVYEVPKPLASGRHVGVSWQCAPAPIRILVLYPIKYHRTSNSSI